MWERILWRKQPYPDNYVPPGFLELKDLQRPRPRIAALVLAALPITQQLSVIAIVVAVFVNLLSGGLSPSTVTLWSSGVSIVVYLLRQWGWKENEQRTSLRPLILPPLLLSLLSPVLGTLTSATTSDTIWPLAGGLFFVHLLLADFTTGQDARRRRRRRRLSRASNVVDEEPTKSLTSSLSLTSALSASIVLASRLPSNAHVFSLVLLAIELFAGWPPVAKGVRESGKPFSIVLTISLVTLALSLAADDQAAAFRAFYFSAIGLVNLIGPLLLWAGWGWKAYRGGKWDVAQVRLKKSSGTTMHIKP